MATTACTSHLPRVDPALDVKLFGRLDCLPNTKANNNKNVNNSITDYRTTARKMAVSNRVHLLCKERGFCDSSAYPRILAGTYPLAPRSTVVRLHDVEVNTPGYGFSDLGSKTGQGAQPTQLFTYLFEVGR